MELFEGITLHRFPASRLGIFSPPFNGRRAVPIRATKALQDSGASVILDGPMFAFCGALPREQCVQAVYMLHDVRRGVHVDSARPDDGMTIAVTGGRVQVFDRARMTGDVAVQLFPELIRGGRVVASPIRDTEREWRAALGWDGQNLVFAIGIGSMLEFAQKLRRAGLIEAGYTDGGGSAKLLSRERRIGASEDRPKAAWLLDSETLPSSPPVTSPSGDALIMGAVAAAIYWLFS